MIALSVKQPWAWLICAGIKNIENRTWKLPKKMKGQRVLIHASAKQAGFIGELINDEQFYYARGVFEEKGKSVAHKLNNEHTKSAIIGSVEIVGCVVNHESIWAEKTHYKFSENPNKPNEFAIPDGKVIYNWVLANPILFPEPIPVKGKLSFWNYPNILAEPEEEAGELFCHCQIPVQESNQVMNMIDHYRCIYCGGKWYK